MNSDMNLGKIFNGGNDTSIDYMATSAMIQTTYNTLEIQTILQLLVAKGVVTREDVQAMRAVVTRNNKDAMHLIDSCKARIERVEEADNFDKNMRAAMNGTATPEEKKAAIEYLDKLKNKHKSEDNNG